MLSDLCESEALAAVTDGNEHLRNNYRERVRREWISASMGDNGPKRGLNTRTKKPAKLVASRATSAGAVNGWRGTVIVTDVEELEVCPVLSTIV